MSQVFHIYRSDLRRLLPLLIGWFGLLLAQSGVAFWFPIDAEPHRHSFLEMVEYLPLTEVALLLLVGQLILGHPVKSSRAHWLTMPINRGHLIAAKGLWIATLLVAPTALAQLVSLHRLGMSPGWIPSALGHALFYLSFLVIGAWVCAVLTNRLSQYLLCMLGLIIGWALLQNPIVHLTLDRNLYLGSYRIVALTRSLIMIQAMVICLVVIGARTIRLRARWSLVAALVGLVLLLTTAAIWNWDGYGADDWEGLEVALNFDYPGHDNSFVGTMSSLDGIVKIYGRLELSPLPKDRYVVIGRTRSLFEITETIRIRSVALGSTISDQFSVEETVLGALVLPQQPEIRYLRDQIFELGLSDYEFYGEQPGNLRLLTTVESYLFNDDLEVPFRDGASVSRREDRWTLRVKATEGRRAEVSYLHQYFGRRPDPRKPPGGIYLVNRKTGKALRPGKGERSLLRTRRGSSSGREAELRSELQRVPRWTRMPVIRRPLVTFEQSTAAFDLPSEIDDPQAWLRDASLVRISSSLDRTAIRELEIGDFRMADYSAPIQRLALGRKSNPTPGLTSNAIDVGKNAP